MPNVKPPSARTGFRSAVFIFLLACLLILPGCTNQPPVLDPVGPKSINGGETLTFTLSATDPDPESELSFYAANLPQGATFNAETRTFTWTPDPDTRGTFTVLFVVMDSGTPPMSDYELVSITVGEGGNRPPQLESVEDIEVDEGEAVEFTITAEDPDAGDTLSYSASNMPADAEFDAESAVFSWTPAQGDSGDYTVLFTVRDNGVPPLSDSLEVRITVGTVNRRPMLDPIGDRTVKEGDLLEFGVTATDPDEDDALTFTASNLPGGAEFDPFDQQFTWQTKIGDAGSYPVLFTVSDDGDPSLSDSEEIVVTVGEGNLPPRLEPVGDKSVDVGEELKFTLSASDPNPEDELTFSASNLPDGARFDAANATFTWIPEANDVGSYDVLFTVTDDGDPALSDSEEIVVTVGESNRPPKLAPIGAKEVDEGELLEFTVTAEDPDAGDEVTLSVEDLPDGAEFDEEFGLFSWTPGEDAAGNYEVTFTATDSGDPPLHDAEIVTISVGGVNRPPVLNAIGDKTVEEGQELIIKPTASDPDPGDILSYSVDGLPGGAQFDTETNTFSWTPEVGAQGDYPVEFSVQDDGEPVLKDYEEIVITVRAGNLAPAFTAVDDITVAPGELVEFTVEAEDPNVDDILTYSVEDLPDGAEFDTETSTFTWTPDAEDVDKHVVIFKVIDDANPPLQDEMEVVVLVEDEESD